MNSCRNWRKTAWRDYVRNELRGRGFADSEIRFCSSSDSEEKRAEFEGRRSRLLDKDFVTDEYAKRYEAFMVEVEPREFHYIFFCPMVDSEADGLGSDES